MKKSNPDPFEQFGAIVMKAIATRTHRAITETVEESKRASDMAILIIKYGCSWPLLKEAMSHAMTVKRLLIQEIATISISDVENDMVYVRSPEQSNTLAYIGASGKVVATDVKLKNHDVREAIRTWNDNQKKQTDEQ
jgi:hypothetical protein